MKQEFILETPDQVGALSHPLRLRVLNLLFDEPRTNSQLAEALGESRARLHFHVQELAKEGLINLVEERPKGGVIEKYYLAAARSYRLSPELATGSPELHNIARTTWETAHQLLTNATDRFGGPPPDLHAGNYQRRLSPEAYARVKGLIRRLENEFAAASESPTGAADDVYLTFTLLWHRLPPDDTSNGGADRS